MELSGIIECDKLGPLPDPIKNSNMELFSTDELARRWALKGYMTDLLVSS